MENKDDQEWIAILSELEKPIEIQDDYLKQYLLQMEHLVLEYRNSNMENVETLLYKIGHMFYCFNINMKKYNKYAASHNMKVYTYEWINQKNDIPGSHNYFLFLTMLTPDVLREYYDKCIESILEYIHTEARKLPKYIYTIKYFNNRKSFTVYTYELIHNIDLKGDFLLPDYYSIVDGSYYLSKEQYEKLFRSEESYQRFLKQEWPIIEWILKTKKMLPFKTFALPS